MPVLSFIACRIFENEIVYLIKNDPAIDEVIVVESEDSKNLQSKLDYEACSYRVLPINELPQKAEQKDNKFTLIVDLLEFALDASPEKLKNGVYREIETMSEYVDGVLIFYGLCGNVLGQVESDFSDYPCYVGILKDEKGEIMDDCIAASLGSRETYLDAIMGCRGEGIYFLTPMQAKYWRDMLKIAGITPDPDNIEMTKYVFDYSGYKKVAKVDTGLDYDRDFEDKVSEFSRLFELDVVEMNADLGLIEKCYQNAKDHIGVTQSD
ncbi:Protein of unknown function DUF1638 [Methanohalobium evestigatum Z-7303]|uniref:DUF1638 domain-containing protein n=1 Tax=Methanohalobium evestigatum (strain ATCC BAA-1072 / DSM 3721 / NBRC 107634 / OCM 161 / Z-7303) TaxID=644295 RepID=D7EAX2_METEZ|nr:DUF1638 domain-containing protein [Methanohalobium evestigatum]ADI74489.1 Protein of unknown function DUF1638 [Methanohalobium evestigatum Z-7303]